MVMSMLAVVLGTTMVYMTLLRFGTAAFYTFNHSLVRYS